MNICRMVLAFAAFACWNARAANYALCVGLDEYSTDYIPRSNWLCQSAVDAESVRDMLVGRCGWRERDVSLVVNGEGTREAILARLKALAEVAEAGDQVVYYHSGHGETYGGEEVCLCAYDGSLDDVDFNLALEDFKVGVKLLIVIDTCYSGGMILMSRDARPGPPALPSIAWITSADYDEYAYELTDGIGGVFTRAWTQGILGGAADSSDLLGDGDGVVTAWESALYASSVISNWSSVQCPEEREAASRAFVLAEAASCGLKEAMDESRDWMTMAEDRDIHGMSYAPFARLDGVGWFGEKDETQDGKAVRSGAIVDYESVTMRTCVSGTGTVSFRWKVSSERNRDWLTFSADGRTVGRISGTDGGWEDFSYEITDGGTHELSWTYEKDRAGSDGADCGWVDLFAWSEGAPVDAGVSPKGGSDKGTEDDSVSDAASAAGVVTLADPQLRDDDLKPVETPAAALTYSGYVTNGEAIVGLVTVKVTTKGVVTATVQLPEGTKLAKTSYKGTLGEGGKAELVCPKNGGKMSALVCEGIVSGTIEVGKEKLGFTARSGAKDVLADLDGFGGRVWTVALKTAPAKGLPELMNGYSVLSVAGGKKGKMKVSGVLADGTKVSVTAQGMAFGDSVVVPVVYRKKKTAFSLKLILKEKGGVQVGNVSAWTSGSEEAAWEKAIASESDNVRAGAKFGLDEADNPESFDVVDAGKGKKSILPNGVPVKAVDASSGKWTLPKAGKVAFAKGTTNLDETKFTAKGETDPNPAGLKLAFKKKTGLFSGSFQFYQQSGDKLKKLKASVNGAVVDGKGYGSGVVKNMGAVPVTVGK